MHQKHPTDVLVHERQLWRPPLSRTVAVDGGSRRGEAGANASNLNHPSFPRSSSSTIRRNRLRGEPRRHSGWILRPRKR